MAKSSNLVSKAGYATVSFLEAELFAEVGRAGHRVVYEVIYAAGEEHFSLADQIAFVDDREDLPGVVVGDEDADAFFRQEANEGFYVLDGDWVDIGKRFVEEEQGGVGRKGTGDFEPPSLSAGEVAGDFFCEFLEVELFEELFEFGYPLFFREGEGLEDAEDVLGDGEGGENRGLLCEVAHPLFGSFMDWPIGDLLSFEADSSLIGGDEADGDVKGSCFSGSIRTKQADDFSFADLK